MKIDFDISGWREDYSYQKYDTVFFTGDYKNSTTGCLQVQSGYYYAEDSQAGAAGAYNSTVALQSPTGASAKWTRSFPSTPSYGSSVNFEAFNDRVDLGDGYYKMVPKGHNSLHATYSLNFNSRTDKEAKAILHFLGHRFETPYSGAQRTDDGIQTLTGFNFTPFSPYNQTGLYHCENFSHEYKFPNVNNVTAGFINDTNSATNWKNRIINLDNTSGFWAAGITYSKFDIVYYSGHNVSNLSGYYYYSGDSASVSDTSNKPYAASTAWSDRNFFFKPTQASETQQPKLLKANLANEYTQRASYGLNSNLLKLKLVFEGRDDKEAKALTHFLINKQGYESFGFTPPRPYKQEYKFFVCDNWSENVIFNENRSVSANFEEYPLNLAPPKTTFKTYLFDTGSPDKGEGAQVIGNADENFHPPDGRDVYRADFGTFMTGFSSGTGFYLANSGNQRITSDLYLSGANSTTGLYKFKDQGIGNQSFSIIDGPATHAQYTLDPAESGFFEVEFATTGKGSLVGTASSPFHKGVMLYERGHGTTYADANTGPNDPISQLYVTTVDLFGAPDPSGTLKVDLTGNASPVAPGKLADFRAYIASGISSPIITGSFEFTEPFTATGVLIEVSGLPNTQSHATSPATGVQEDFNSFFGMFGYHRNYYLDPLKNHYVTLTTSAASTSEIEDDYKIQKSTEEMGGVFDFYCKPGQTYYFRARSQNIDIIGGNLNGGTSRTVLSSDYVHTSVTIPERELEVPVTEAWANKVKTEWGEGVASIGPRKTFNASYLENTNLHGFISGTLSGAKTARNLDNRLGNNSDLDIDDFLGIHCTVGEEVIIFSADHTVPALTTGPKVTFAGGGTVPLTLSVSETARILGAGGKGADSFEQRRVGDNRGFPAVSFIKAPGQPGMDRSNCKAGSVIELQGTGPISLYATSGLMDGKYILPAGGDSYATNTKPQNAQDGGTAFHIDASYNGELIKLHNIGFIGGGGGGGGAGGARMSNMSALLIWQNRPNWSNEDYVNAGGDADIRRDMNKDGTKIYSMLNSFMKAGSSTTPGFRQGGDVTKNPHMMQHRSSMDSVGKALDGLHTNRRDIRPGGGGGAGCGYDYEVNTAVRANYGEAPKFLTSSVSNNIALKSDGAGDMVGIATSAVYPEGFVGIGTDGIILETTKSLRIVKTKGGKGTRPRGFGKTAKTSAAAPTLYQMVAGSSAGHNCHIDIGQPWNSVPGRGGDGASWMTRVTPPYQLTKTAEGTWAEDIMIAQHRGYVTLGDPSGMNVFHPDETESFYNGGGFGGDGGFWGEDGTNGEHPVQNYIDRYISSAHGPEPRNFSYAGTGGLCIETNGAKIEFTPTGYTPSNSHGSMFEEPVLLIPASGQDAKSKEDAKSSELYRNVLGIGGYVTCKHTSFTARAAGETLPIGYISGLCGRRFKASDTADYDIDFGDESPYTVGKIAGELVFTVGTTAAERDKVKNIAGPSFEDVDRRKANSSNAISQNASGSGMLPWKAFNQTIDGSFDDYVLFDSGAGGQVGFPYYLIYDLGEGNETSVGSFSLTSAGASLSYYQNGDNHLNLFGECYSPTEFELRATNLPPDTAGVAESVADSTVATHMLDKNTTVIWQHEGYRAVPNKESGKIEKAKDRRRIREHKRLDGLDIGGGTIASKFFGKDEAWAGRNLSIHPAQPFRYPKLNIIPSSAGAGSGRGPAVLYDPDGDGTSDKPLNAIRFDGAVKNFNGNKFNHYVCVPGATRRYMMYPLWKKEKTGDGEWDHEIVFDSTVRTKYRYYILKIFSADNFQGEVLPRSFNVQSADGGKCKIADFGLRGWNIGYAGFISIGG